MTICSLPNKEISGPSEVSAAVCTALVDAVNETRTRQDSKFAKIESSALVRGLRRFTKWERVCVSLRELQDGSVGRGGDSVLRSGHEPGYGEVKFWIRRIIAVEIYHVVQLRGEGK